MLVFTSYFGTGVDRDDIRFVAHLDEQSDFTNYVQQVRRGGRDGKETYCLCIYSTSSKDSLSDDGPSSEEEQVYRQFLTTSGCRRTPMSSYFDGVAVNCRSIDTVFCDRYRRDRHRDTKDAYVRA